MDTGDFSRGLRGSVVKLTTELHLLPRLRMGGDIPLLRHVPSRRGFLILRRDNFACYLRLHSKLKRYCAGDKIEKTEMGWACGAYG